MEGADPAGANQAEADGAAVIGRLLDIGHVSILFPGF
jgi:hypothetical protein